MTWIKKSFYYKSVHIHNAYIPISYRENLSTGYIHFIAFNSCTIVWRKAILGTSSTSLAKWVYGEKGKRKEHHF